MGSVGVVRGGDIKKAIEGKKQIPQPWLWPRRKNEVLATMDFPALSGVPQGTCAF